jgi:hypothetical protein
METSTSHFLSFSQRASSRGSAQQSRSARRQSLQVEPRASLRPRAQPSGFKLLASQNSRWWQGLPAPSLVLRCRRAVSFIGPSQVVGCRRQSCAAQAVAPGLVRSAANGLVSGASMSELAVAWHIHRRAASPHRRPNPSVKGTSRKRAAPYVER